MLYVVCVLAVVCLALGALVVWLCAQLKQGQTQVVQQRQRLDQVVETAKVAKTRALDAQRVIVKGKVMEVLAPFLPDFPAHPGDCRFIGSPVDFISFDGMSEGEIHAVTLIEVKTGKARLSQRQRQLRNLTTDWNKCKVAVRFMEYRVPEGRRDE